MLKNVVTVCKSFKLSSLLNMPVIILTLKYHSDDININPYYYSYYNVLLNELIGG